MKTEFPEGNLHCQGFEGPCENHNAARQRQDTKYVNDEHNWVTLCPNCAKANAEYWRNMWSDYYSSCL